MFTAAQFDQMTTNDAWLGFGYLGERRNLLEGAALMGLTDEQATAMVRDADEEVLAYATANGWTAQDFFDWANSKDGRWYADCHFGGTPEIAHRHLRRQEA